MVTSKEARLPHSQTITDIQASLSWISQLDVSAMKLGLGRMQHILMHLENPQDSLSCIHIAGTNGKGSVTAMLRQVLIESGYRVGCFISPHLIDMKERITINGNFIPDAIWVEETARLKLYLETHQERAEWPTYFEFLTILAFQCFKKQAVDICLIETGLGGRLDATNSIKKPELTVITSIGWDHMHHLGNTLNSIATEKAGIIKQHVPLVLGSSIPESVLPTITTIAMAKQATIHQANADTLNFQEPAIYPPRYQSLSDALTGKQYQLNLMGTHQKDNLATVLSCLRILRKQYNNITDTTTERALTQVEWPARLQYFPDRHLIVDGSHNADGFKHLADSLKQLFYKEKHIVWLLSLRKNRDTALLESLLQDNFLSNTSLNILLTEGHPRHLYHGTETLKNALSNRQTRPPETIYSYQNPAEALKQLQQLQTQHNKTPLGVITGSLYTAGHVLSHLKNMS